MRRAGLLGLVAWALVLCSALVGRAADDKPYTRTEDGICGRKYGTALTMDVFAPKEGGNGAGIIWAVSGGWFSSHEAIGPQIPSIFLRRGYTVFAVVHGSQPRYTIPEAVADMNRAVRFIRYHARRFHIDPDRIGVVIPA